MSPFALLAALLGGASPASSAPPPPAPPAPALLAVQFEAARKDLGCFALWKREDGWVDGADACPEASGHQDAGMLLDTGGVPFRTWVEVDFDAGLLSFLDGRFGVGFAPRIWLSETVFAQGTEVGAAGSMRFEGALTVGIRGTKVEEEQPVVWERGFLHDPAGGAAEHAFAWREAVPLRTQGKRGPYRYAITGTLHVNMHLYTAP